MCFLLIFRTSLRTTLSRKLVVRPAGQNHFPLFTWGSSRTERRSSQIDSLVTNFRCWTTQTPFYLLWHRLIFSRSRFSSSSQLKWFLSLFGGHFQVDASSSRHNRKTGGEWLFKHLVITLFLIYLLQNHHQRILDSKPTKKKWFELDNKKEERDGHKKVLLLKNGWNLVEHWKDHQIHFANTTTLSVGDLILMILDFWSEESSQWKKVM